MLKKTATQIEPKGDSFIMAFGSKETGKLFLPEDGTLVPKHVGEIHLTYVLIRSFAFSWYN